MAFCVWDGGSRITVTQVRLLTGKLARVAAIKANLEANLDRAEGNKSIIKQAVRFKEDVIEMKKEKTKQANQLCICCVDAVRSWAMYPCGHRAFCQECAQKILSQGQQKYCPVCREEVVSCNRIYL